MKSSWLYFQNSSTRILSTEWKSFFPRRDIPSDTNRNQNHIHVLRRVACANQFDCVRQIQATLRCPSSLHAHESFYPHGVKNIIGNEWDDLKKCGNARELTEMTFGMATAIRFSTDLNSRLPARLQQLQIPVPAGGATS
jgi:hypothetical protein